MKYVWYIYGNIDGQINNLMKAEHDADVHSPVAMQILACGVFFKFDFLLMHFQTEGVTADLFNTLLCGREFP